MFHPVKRYSYDLPKFQRFISNGLVNQPPPRKLAIMTKDADEILE